MSEYEDVEWLRIYANLLENEVRHLLDIRMVLEKRLGISPAKGDVFDRIRASTQKIYDGGKDAL